MRPDQQASLLSFHCNASADMSAANRVHPQPGDTERPPAVAGKFYPATANGLASAVRALIPDQSAFPKARWRAAMLPHAGLKYSGRVAAEVLACLEIPERVIVIGPKHTRLGVDWAVAPHRSWALPGLTMAGDPELAQMLAENIGSFFANRKIVERTDQTRCTNLPPISKSWASNTMPPNLPSFY